MDPLGYINVYCRGFWNHPLEGIHQLQWWDNDKFPLFSRELHLVNMAIQNGPLEDVPPIKTEGSFYCNVSLPEFSDMLDRCPRSTCLTAKLVLFWDHRISMNFTRGFRTMHLRAMYFMYTPVIQKRILYRWKSTMNGQIRMANYTPTFCQQPPSF